MAEQEGLESLREKYFDIMLVGQTGQGKSTMADKLLIANPNKVKYVSCIEEHNQSENRVQLEDISMWFVHENSEIESREHLENLVLFRTKPNPHAAVNAMRQNPTNTSTSYCQLLSNDKTMVRILDVPGFGDKDAYSIDPNTLNDPRQAASNIAAYNMRITRNIIRIQSAFGMCFRRVVYFLPCRGPLERATALLQSELHQLEFAFGHSIFDCMVLVATVSKRVSLKDSTQEVFTQEDVDQCEEFFLEALKKVRKVGEEEPKVPIIFVSLAESCESILKKIKGTIVSQDGLELRFNPNSCTNCGVRVLTLGDERLICSVLDDHGASMPYEESTCHPVLAFKYSILSAFLPRKISRAITRRWPSYREEYCVNCRQRPGESGCLKVGQTYRTWWGKVYDVDHTSEVTEPVAEPPVEGPGEPPVEEPAPRQTDQCGAAIHGCIPPTPFCTQTDQLDAAVQREEGRKGI